jgi:hypothetical protein
MDGARVAGTAPLQAAAENAPDLLRRKGILMKTPLIALAFAFAATAATAQPAAPAAVEPAPAPTPHAVHRSGHALLHADRERVKADKARLRRARGARNDAAVRDAEARLRNDMAAWHADRERLKR